MRSELGKGHVIATVDRDGKRREYKYDELGRMYQERWVNIANGPAFETVDWKHDAGDQLRGTTFGDTTYTFTYDTLNRTESVAGPFGITLTYDYDGLSGLVESRTDSQGGTLTSTYDNAGRLDDRTLSSSHGSMRVDVDYTPRNQIDTLYRTASGTSGVFFTDFNYDNLGRTKAVSHLGNGSNFATITVQYDQGGRVHKVEDDFDDNPVTRDFRFSRQEVYADDPKTWMGEMNRLDADEDWDYHYHNEGMLKDRLETVIVSEADLWEYEYDHANRLVKMISWKDEDRDPDHKVMEITYQYDSFGNRVARTVWSAGGQTVTEKFAFEGQRLFADVDASETITLRYLQGNGSEDLWGRLAGTSFWYATDHTGNIRQSVGLDGNVKNYNKLNNSGTRTYSSDQNWVDRWVSTRRQEEARLNPGKPATALVFSGGSLVDPGMGQPVGPDTRKLQSGDFNQGRNTGFSPTDIDSGSGLWDAITSWQSWMTGDVWNRLGQDLGYAAGAFADHMTFGLSSMATGWFSGNSSGDWVDRDSAAYKTGDFLGAVGSTVLSVLSLGAGGAVRGAVGGLTRGLGSLKTVGAVGRAASRVGSVLAKPLVLPGAMAAAGGIGGGLSGNGTWDTEKAIAGAISFGAAGAGISMLRSTNALVSLAGNGLVSAGVGSASSGGLLQSGGVNWSGWGIGAGVGAASGLAAGVAGYGTSRVLGGWASTYTGMAISGVMGGVAADSVSQFIGTQWLGQKGWNLGQSFFAGLGGGVGGMITHGLTQHLRHGQFAGAGLAGRAKSKVGWDAFVLGNAWAGAVGGAVSDGMMQGWRMFSEGASWSWSSLLTSMATGAATAAGSAVAQWKYHACFAARTPLLTPDGHRFIEQIQEGDLVLSRDEHDLEGEVTPKVVEEVFVRTAPIAHLHVEDQVIRTTAEHPFFVKDKGWTPCGELEPGDLIASHDDQWIEVEEVLDTGEVETVYNMRVADYHTYFVGATEWGFSLWAHNTYSEGVEEALLRSLSSRRVSKELKEQIIGLGKRQDIPDWIADEWASSWMGNSGKEAVAHLQDTSPKHCSQFILDRFHSHVIETGFRLMGLPAHRMYNNEDVLDLWFELPQWQEGQRVQGTLVLRNTEGETILYPLASGIQNTAMGRILNNDLPLHLIGNGYPARNGTNDIPLSAHIEPMAAAIMRRLGVTRGTLVQNLIPCSGGGTGCRHLLPNYLAEGSVLRVHYPVRDGLELWMREYTGVADL